MPTNSQEVFDHPPVFWDLQRKTKVQSIHKSKGGNYNQQNTLVNFFEVRTCPILKNISGNQLAFDKLLPFSYLVLPRYLFSYMVLPTAHSLAALSSLSRVSLSSPFLTCEDVQMLTKSFQWEGHWFQCLSVSSSCFQINSPPHCGCLAAPETQFLHPSYFVDPLFDHKSKTFQALFGSKVTEYCCLLKSRRLFSMSSSSRIHRVYFDL